MRIGINVKNYNFGELDSFVCGEYDHNIKYDIVFEHEEIQDEDCHKIKLLKEFSDYALENNNWQIEYLILPLYWNKGNMHFIYLNDSRSVVKYKFKTNACYFNEQDMFYETVSNNLIYHYNEFLKISSFDSHAHYQLKLELDSLNNRINLLNHNINEKTNFARAKEIENNIYKDILSKLIAEKSEIEHLKKVIFDFLKK